MTMPIITIDTIRIANFSSPHPFTFDTGEVLPACSDERSRKFSLRMEEVETSHPSILGAVDVEPVFHMTDEIYAELARAEREADVVFVPFPMLKALRDAGELERFSRVRTCITANRQARTVHHNRFGR